MVSMLSKFKEIAEGWLNSIDCSDDIKEMGERRAIICAKCPLNIDNTCDKRTKGTVKTTFTYKGEIRQEGQLVQGCGCPLKQKVLSPSTQCPLNNWDEN